MNSVTFSIRRVKVDRTRSAYDALKATGCELHLDMETVEQMPQGRETEVEVEFFHDSGTPEDIFAEYIRRGLVPVDLFTLAALNEADHTLAGKHRNATVWRDASGKYCGVRFRERHGERSVGVYQLDKLEPRDHEVLWYYAGVRQT